MFKIRSHTKELLDQENIPEQDLFLNLKELDIINHLLGGYDITFSALQQLITPNKIYTLVDIGCGGGNTLKRINSWRYKNGYKINLYGVDIKSVCVQYAKNENSGNTIKFICDDYKNVYNHVPQIDIIHACLFCHHLLEEEIVELIKFANQNKSTLVINDLERNPIAYYAIKLLTKLFSKSYLVKNDAPLSVLRGFTKREWQAIVQSAGVTHYSIKYKWAFRHQVIVYAGT
jgi:2-polyprenyl-3-methyl-5-hydroxy-6-metoxy-1,4-benzoquinol methylase